jgi:hypothetical protein
MESEKGKLRSASRMLRRVLPHEKGAGFRLAVVSIFIFLVWLLLPKSEAEKHDYEIGKSWQEDDLIAPIDFPIVKSDVDLKKEREERLLQTPMVFLVDDPLRGGRARLEIWLARVGEEYIIWKNLNAQERLMPRERYEKIKARMHQALNKLDPNQDLSAYFSAYEAEPNFPAIKAQTLSFYDSLYRYGYVNRPIREINREFVSLRTTPSKEVVREKGLLVDDDVARQRVSRHLERYSRPVALLLQNALLFYCRPNFYFHENLTKEEEEAALASVSLHYDKVNKGEVIIGYGEKVTPEKARKIESLYFEISKSGSEPNAYFSLRSLGQFVVLLILMSILLRFLKANRIRIYEDGRRFLMLFTIYFTVTAITLLVHRLGAGYSAEYKVQSVYMAPFGMACIMLAIFFDDRVGFISNILLALIVAIALPNSFEYLFLQTCAGSFIIFRLNRVRKRSQFFSSVLLLLAIYVSAYFAYGFYPVSYTHLRAHET